MKYHKQTITNDMFGGGKGSCYPTTIACLLDLELEEIPFFNLCYWNKEEDDNIYKGLMELSATQFDKKYWIYKSLWSYILEAFLFSKGYKEVFLYDDEKEEWLKNNPNTPYMVTGETVRGTRHVCIYMNGQLHHDPHPDNTGLVKEEENIGILEKI